ncbi:MAG: DUF1415 domain-containing protein [Burkholderiales bacterium]
MIVDLPPESDPVIARTREWLEKAVIGLNLCPFAKPVHLHQRIRFCVSNATTEDELVGDLSGELQVLQDADPRETETTLLIHPGVLNDFADYNAFLDLADATVEAMDLVGEIQVASFHPHYQFAGTEPEDISNFSNRSPYPTLHLLRESSVEQALAAFPDADAIYERNIETLKKLGAEGWRSLWKDGKP